MIAVEGRTLGERHAVLNRRTNQTVAEQVVFEEVEKLPEFCDTDRLYKIDVAAKYRHVSYIITNLVSDDDLYVARAIKKAPWLFKDEKYADIMNPDHLERNLFPKMSTRSVARVLLAMRLNLKDEVRSELFYKYYESKDKKEDAMKWLPKCSIPFIEEKVKLHWRSIDSNLFKRLCERSFKVFEFVMEKRKKHYEFTEYFNAAVFLLNDHTEELLNIYETLPTGRLRPRFKKHATKIIVSKFPDRIKSKIDIYIRHIDLAELGKQLKAEETKEIILKLAKMKFLREIRFDYDYLKPLLKTIPVAERFQFVKKVFIDKTQDVEEENIQSDSMKYSSSLSVIKSKHCCAKTSNVNISDVYQWYRTAPFHVAFAELKKLIRTESKPEERVAMLKVLITSARKNESNIHILLQYFRERHINEPAHCKASFIKSLTDETTPYRFDDQSWKLFDEILHSLEVYTESDKLSELDGAISAIITYNLLHNKPVPEAILKKFMNNFDTLSKVRKGLTEEEKVKVYNFLREELQKKLDQYTIDDKRQIDSVVLTLNMVISLMSTWDQDISKDEKVMEIIKTLLRIREPEHEFSSIYGNSKWRRELFEHSIDLSRCRTVYENALKHDPNLIIERRSALDYVIKTDSVNMTKVLRKLRIYFPNTLGAEFVKILEEKLKSSRNTETEKSTFAFVCKGICLLMARERFVKILQEYIPQDFKVKWSDEDPALINIRKFLALNMYTVRPTVHVETVTVLAKGDYLQYALPSIMSVFQRMPKQQCYVAVPNLLNSAVSLQKHGIRLAFTKFEPDELATLFEDLWKKSTNATIRTTIFNFMLDLLIREKNEDKAVTFWRILKTFTEGLTIEEDRSLYYKMSQVGNVPKVVRGEYIVVSYNFLKSLPAPYAQNFAKYMIQDISINADLIDETFITEILLSYINEMYKKRLILMNKESAVGDHYHVRKLIAKFIICSKDAATQIKRYNVILKVILHHTMAMWNQVGKDNVKPKEAFSEIVDNLMYAARDDVLGEKEYINPIEVFTSLKSEVSQLSLEENYLFDRKISLIIAFWDSYNTIAPNLPDKMETDAEDDDHSPTKNKYIDEINQILAPVFAEKCIKGLYDDMETIFPTIRNLFVKAVRDFLDNYYSIPNTFQVCTLRAFIQNTDDVQANLLALELYPTFISHLDDKLKTEYIDINKKLSENSNKEVKFLFHSINFTES